MGKHHHEKTSCSDSSSNQKKKCNSKQFQHNIQLQLSDSLGFPVPGTEFWITLTIIKEGNKVTIQVPVINFQTGPSADNPIELPALVPGGYLYTSDGFLPKEFHHNNIVPISVLAASNNGMSQPFSFTVTPAPPYANIPTGYILSITNAGGLNVSCAGTFGNIIPVGPQIVLPAEISYIVKPKIRLGTNYVVDSGFTNITQFTGNALNNGIRDSHVNDAFDGVTAWAWTSNSNIVDKTNGTLNVFVAIGKIKNGKLKIGKPFQLTNLPPEIMGWDTAVAINRTNRNNIVVSWLQFNNIPLSITFRAVSFDGGKTWPINGPTNIQPTGFIAPGIPGGAGDNPGMRSDKFGNIWYLTTNFFDDFGNLINQPVFWISSDEGITYSIAYTLSAPASGFFYDFPQFSFGGDGSGNYGIWFVADYVNPATGDLVQSVGFLPITGLGQFGTANVAQLTSLINTNQVSNITASIDGRVWYQGTPNLDDGPLEASSYIQPQVVTFKSPGPIDQNYAGPWNTAILSNGGQQYGASTTISSPDFSYFTGPQSIIYDDSRQALYALACTQSPELSQNMRLYFIISRDNGQTWSDPIDIETDDFANRGFQSMALDPVTGNLVIGWYDGRNDPTYHSVQYFGAIITKCELDKLVEKIPLSNPLYILPPATVSQSTVSQSTNVKVELTESQKTLIKKHLEKKFKRLPRKP